MRRSRAIAGIALLGSITLVLPLGGEASPDRPAARGSAYDVTVRDASGRPCRVVKVDDDVVRGGCARGVEGKLRFAVNTPVGRMPIAICDFRAVLRVDRRGKALLTLAEVQGITPCPDIQPCAENQGNRTMVGRFVAGEVGPIRYDLTACFDGCLSRLRGALELPLVKQFGQWQLVPDVASIGRSGLEVDGALEIEGPALLIRAG